jgi:hypothetical protein
MRARIPSSSGRGQRGGVRAPEQGAAITIRLAPLPDDGPTGGFFEDAGVVPW